MRYTHNVGVIKNTNRLNIKNIIITGLLLATSLALGLQTVFAAGSITIRPDDLQGWTVTSETLGAKVEFVDDSSSPLGDGALKLTTGTDSDSQAQMSKLDINAPLSSVAEMSYWTYQNDVNRFGREVPAYQLRIDIDGSGQYVTNFHYYPFYNAVVDSSLPDVEIGTWQNWNVLTGQWAAYEPIEGTFDPLPELTPGEGGINGGIAGAGRGGGEFYTIEDIMRKYPDAQVLGVGVSLGPLYEDATSYADGISINDTIYNFEPELTTPQQREDCTKDGWRSFDFKNQGQCIKFVKTEL